MGEPFMRGIVRSTFGLFVRALFDLNLVRRKRLIHECWLFLPNCARSGLDCSERSERRPVTIPALAIRTTVPTVALTSRSCPKRSRDVCLSVRVLCVCAPCEWPWPRPAAPGAWHRAPIS